MVLCILMIETAVAFMQTIISQYGAWGVFGATLLEELVAPIPSPIVPLAAGFFLISAQATFAAAALKSALTIALPVTLGISIGSSVMYALGYFGGKPVIESTKTWTGVKWEDIEKIEARLTRGRGDELILFILRVLPVVPGVAISGLCGVARYPYKTFLMITVFGAFLRAFALGLLGWQVGELYETYAHAISSFEKYILAALILIVLIAGGFFLWKKFGQRSSTL